MSIFVVIYIYIYKYIYIYIYIKSFRGYMDIFLSRYVLKAQGSRPGAPKRMYEYIPY